MYMGSCRAGAQFENKYFLNKNMDKLRLKNFRCFKDTGEVDIKPITVLIGANSSGKSSFLKTFPLMKQSVGEMVNGAFLWAGPLVDMKDFDNTVRSGENEIILEYTIGTLPVYRPAPMQKEELKNVKLEICLSKRDSLFDFIKSIVIRSKDIELIVEYSPDFTSKMVFNSVISIYFNVFKLV